MKKSSFIVILSLLLCDTIHAQNNPIFQGGIAGGFVRTSFAQSAGNIFTGGNGQGWTQATFAMNSGNIFTGGTGDGWNRTDFQQPANGIFPGGASDGWHFTGLLQSPNLIYGGGTGDGWSSTYRPTAPLPVNLVYFNARKIASSQALLDWETSSELNSAWFDVERSYDAIHFSAIGRVNGRGNSSVPFSYHFTDATPVKGVNFYRLKMVDLDGKYRYTPARSLVFGETGKTSLECYPNPTTGKFKISLPENGHNERTVLNIFGLNGVMIKQIRFDGGYSNPVEVDISGQAKGIYLIQAVAGGQTYFGRIILQ